jgi:tetratricopeptide (TPR) repeat protein
LGLKLFIQNSEPNNARKSFVNFVSEINAAKPLEINHQRLIRIPNWLMVAAASIVLVVGLFINQYVHEVSIHMVDDPLPVYLSDENIVLNKAMAQYKKGDYEAAVASFNKLTSDTANYYAAICYELTENYAESVLKLKQVPIYSVFYTKSRIRLAAVHIELNNFDQAKLILNNLMPGDDSDAQRIKSIKIRLK